MEKRREIDEFIGYVRDDLMEIYGVDEGEALSLIKNLKLRAILNEHGEMVAHYPTEELAKMAYEKRILQNH